MNLKQAKKIRKEVKEILKTAPRVIPWVVYDDERRTRILTPGCGRWVYKNMKRDWNANRQGP